jgi:hypothetical protein
MDGWMDVEFVRGNRSVFVLGFWFLDGSGNAILVAARAVLPDLIPSSQQSLAFSIQQAWSSAGLFLGYTIGSAEWSESTFARFVSSSSCISEDCIQLRVCFLCLCVVLCFFCAVSAFHSDEKRFVVKVLLPDCDDDGEDDLEATGDNVSENGGLNSNGDGIGRSVRGRSENADDQRSRSGLLRERSPTASRQTSHGATTSSLSNVEDESRSRRIYSTSPLSNVDEESRSRRIYSGDSHESSQCGRVCCARRQGGRGCCTRDRGGEDVSGVHSKGFLMELWEAAKDTNASMRVVFGVTALSWIGWFGFQIYQVRIEYV